jgi:hypothetical protein
MYVCTLLNSTYINWWKFHRCFQCNLQYSAPMTVIHSSGVFIFVHQTLVLSVPHKEKSKSSLVSEWSLYQMITSFPDFSEMLMLNCLLQYYSITIVWEHPITQKPHLSPGCKWYIHSRKVSGMSGQHQVPAALYP